MLKIKHILSTAIIVAGFIAAPALAQTPDGQKPAEEKICAAYGSGKVFGLCNAYG